MNVAFIRANMWFHEHFKVNGGSGRWGWGLDGGNILCIKRVYIYTLGH